MNFIKRAWLYTWAKKGKTALLILVTSAILTFVLAGLTIHNAANSAVENAKRETGATVTLQVSRDYMMKQMEANRAKESSSSSSNEQKEPPKMTMTPIPLASAEKIASKSGVRSYLFTTSTTVTAGDGITAISSSSDSSKNQTQGGPGGGGPMGASGDFTVTGVNTTASVSDFSNGNNTISQGSGIDGQSKDNQVLISEDLAKANKLSVGDQFTLTATINNSSKSFKVTVVGIYQSTATVTSSQIQNKASNPQNLIYTTISTANQMKGTTDSLDSAVFTLEEPSKKQTFVEEAQTDIDSEKFEITSNDQVYQQMLSPLNGIASIAQNIVLLVALAGAVILTLIVILSIRERRYEIGVLMSLGESRLKIIGQFFLELLIVTLVSLGIAGIAGNAVGNALGQELLNQQASSQQQSMGGPGGGPNGQGPDSQGQKQEESNTTKQDTNSSQSNTSSKTTTSQKPQGGPPAGGPGGGPADRAQAINKLQIKQTPLTIARLGGIALFLTFLSTLLASLGILRMKPKDILSSH